MNYKNFSTPRAHCVIGGPLSGKTYELVKQAVLLANTTNKRILYLCANPLYCTKIENALKEQNITSVQIDNAAHFAHAIVSEHSAQDIIKRGSHILDETEEALLFEDLRLCGCKQHRLREILEFLKRGWCDLADEDESWLQTKEEHAIHTLIKTRLAFTGGVLRAELARFALFATQNKNDIYDKFSYPHILVDDYHSLSRAMQLLLNYQALESITVASDELPDSIGTGYTPYSQGISEFTAINPHAEVVRLDTSYHLPPMVDLINTTRLNTSTSLIKLKSAYNDTLPSSTTKEAISTFFANSPDDEIRKIISVINETLQSGVDVQNIALVSTNKTWLSCIKAAFDALAIPAVTLHKKPPSPFRTMEKCEEIKRITLNRLAQDPHDSLAWRTWLALGDHLANSASIGYLQSIACEKNQTLSEILTTFDFNNTTHCGLSNLYARYQDALTLLKSFESENFTTPANATTGITLDTPDNIKGHFFHTIIFSGFVNGCIPSRDFCNQGVMVGQARQREWQAGLRALNICAQSAQVRLVFTGFTRCNLEVAEQLNLYIKRIRLEKNIRMCDIEPSAFMSIIGKKENAIID